MKILSRIKHTFLELLPPTIFFFLVFILLLATKQMALRKYGISWEEFWIIFVGALLAGKVVLLADKFPFMNIFNNRPLIYNTIWKSSVYFLTSLLLHYFKSMRHVVTETAWPQFWLIQMWFAVLFFVYCGARELTKVVGKDKLIQMFFGVRNNTNQI